MLTIEGKRINLTRGDIAKLKVSAKTDEGTDYEFQVGDILRIKIMKRNNPTEVFLSKDTIVETVSTIVDIDLESSDTKIGDYISRPTQYWYEIELNPDTEPQTIIGYDPTGEALFVLYPEGAEEE